MRAHYDFSGGVGTPVRFTSKPAIAPSARSRSHNPARHRLTRFAGQRVRSAEIVVEMMNGRPLVVLRFVFNTLTFKSDGTLVSTLRDRHVRARAELALALDSPDPLASVAEASTRFVARGGQWKPPSALVRRIEQTALGRLKCPRLSPA